MKIKLLSYTRLNPALIPLSTAGISDLSTLWQASNSTDPEKIIEYAARTCYRSNASMGSSPGFIRKCLDSKHWDIIEHGWATFGINGDWNNQARQWSRANRYLEVNRHHKYDSVVSGNFRVWLDLLSMDCAKQMQPYLQSIAPAVFGEATEQVDTTMPALQVIAPSSVESGPMRVTLLGYSHPGVGVQHSSATFLFEGISRTCTHQLVRHRLGSFCLDGDTVVPAFKPRSGSSCNKWTMRQLWQWSQDSTRNGRIKLMRLRGVNERNELIPVCIKKVINCGIQPIYLVKTESGRSIRSTMNHQFYTPNGWSILSNLSVGDSVWANGIEAYKNKEYIAKRYLADNMERSVLAKELGVADATLGKWIAKFGLQKPVSQRPNRRPGHGRKGMFSEETKALISARMSGENNHRWGGDNVGHGAGRLRANKMYDAVCCERCKSTYRLQRHHRDKNPINNDVNNVIVLCEPCHKAEHFGQVVMTVFPDRITSIEFAGYTDTYDLEIEHECHNFVANGFVVHNSQESQRYVGLEKGQWRAIIPPSVEADPAAWAVMQDAWSAAESAYARLLALGIRKEDARFLLPNAAETRIVTTMNFAGWQHFFELRALDKAAQWEIRGMAQLALSLLAQVAPDVFGSQMALCQSKFPAASQHSAE